MGPGVGGKLPTAAELRDAGAGDVDRPARPGRGADVGVLEHGVQPATVERHAEGPAERFAVVPERNTRTARAGATCRDAGAFAGRPECRDLAGDDQGVLMWVRDRRSSEDESERDYEAEWP